MPHEKAKTFAVQVASEAIRSGDAEAIADAQIGLAAHGLQNDDIARQLATAAQLLDPARALAGAAGDTGFAGLMVAAWARKDFAAVSFGFSQLKMGVSAEDVAKIDAALVSANGKRRSELRSPADVVAIALEVKGGAKLARRDADDRGWRKKLTTRTFAVLTSGEGLTLEIGTESVASYSSAIRLTTELTLAIATVEPMVPPAARGGVTVVADVTASLPHALRTQLEEALRGEPSTDRFGRAMTVLSELKDPEVVAPAVALVERYVSLWPDELRATSWQFSELRWTEATRGLPRALSVGRDQLAAHSEALGETGRARIVELELQRPLRRAEVESADPDALVKFPSLRVLRLHELSQATRAWRLPPSLRVLRLGIEVDLEWALERIASDAPQVERVEVVVGASPALAKLPTSIALHVANMVRSGQPKLLADRLGARAVQGLTVSASMWSEVADELDATPLGQQLEQLELECLPDQLENVLRGERYPKLKRLRVELPVRHARMHRRKPPDYTFTQADVDALIEAPFFASLDSLELLGVLGEERAAWLVDALLKVRPKLTRLVLNAGEIGNDALEKLLTSGVLSEVRELELFRCKLKAGAFAAFTHEYAPQRLEKLVLAKNAVAAPALEKFCAWPGLASVKRLDLREIAFSPAQLEMLGASPWIRREAIDLTDAAFW
ncbi:MAG: hypothetical protein QM817_17695 [Archangium sp.]